MGFNKRIISKEQCFVALATSSLKSLYGKSDMLIFEDTESSEVYSLYKSGLSDEEIAKKFNIERTITQDN
jgi:DNA-binding NarL/FixJ family response regulator